MVAVARSETQRSGVGVERLCEAFRGEIAVKVLILSVCNTEHAYFIRRIRDAFPDTAVVKVGGPDLSKAPAERRPERARPSLARRVRETIVDRIGTMRQRRLAQRLFPPGEDSSISISLRLPNPNTPEAQEQDRKSVV